MQLLNNFQHRPDASAGKFVGVIGGIQLKNRAAMLVFELEELFLDHVSAMLSVKITTTQKEPAGLAHQLAARLAQMRPAVRAIAGDVRRRGLWFFPRLSVLGPDNGTRLRLVHHCYALC